MVAPSYRLAGMNEERLGSTAVFSEQLAGYLRGIAEAEQALPTDDELARLVELSFFASLHEEEARRTEITLAWTGAMRGCEAVVALRAPVPATPKNIAKLAPAARRGSTSLAVRADGDELSVWALLQHRAGHELPHMIRLLAPGVRRVDYLGQPRALYARGETLFLGETVRSPARRLTEVFASWRQAAGAGGIDPRAAVVTRIASRALAHGHGGMILLLPRDAEPRGVRAHYEVGHGADLLASRYAELVEDLAPDERLARVGAPLSRGAHTQREQAQVLFDDAIELVAGLTGTDNALLLDSDLRIRGFGVQVIEGEAPLETFEHVSPYTGSSHVDDISTFKGTRHPAGVIFCLRQEGEAAAIIASQDGRLSLAAKDARGVEVLGSYERAFGWR